MRPLRLADAARWWKWAGYVDKFLIFPVSLARHVHWADVVHVVDHSNSIYVPWVDSKPNVVTCHDVIAIQAALGIVKDWKVGWTGRIFQSMISSGFAHADLVICDSTATRRDVLDAGPGRGGSARS